MSYAHAAGIITETGTDANYDLLEVLPEVNASAYGIGGAAIDVIHLPNTIQLEIDGTQTHDPDAEKLIFEKEPIRSGGECLIVNGTYNYGVARTSGARTVYSKGQGIIGATDGSSSSSDDFVIVKSGATWNWYGGVIAAGGLFTAANGGIVNIYEGTFINTHASNSTQFRFEANDLTNSNLINVYGLTLTGTFQPAILVTNYSWATMVVTFENGGFRIPAGGGGDNTMLNPVAARNINSYEIDFNVNNAIDVKELRIVNPDVPFAYNVAGGAKSGLATERRATLFNLTNLDGSPAQDTKCYAVDNLDGGFREAIAGIDYTADQVYQFTSSGGVADFGEVIISLVTANNTGSATLEPRWIGDTIVIDHYAYGDQPGEASAYLYGNGQLTINKPVLPNTLITESDRATVAAYTSATAATSRNVYDAAALKLEVLHGTYFNLFLGRSGTILELAGETVTIDNSAGDFYDFDGTNHIIHSPSYTGGVTGGTLYQLNGATLNSLVMEAATWHAVQSTWTGSADASSIIDVATAATYDATGFAFSATSTINNSSGGTVNIKISGGQQQPLTTGGTVNFLAAGAEITFTGLTDATVEIYDSGNTSVSRVTAQTGSYVYTAPDGSSGTWRFVVDRVGYNRLRGTFDPVGNGAEVVGTLDQLLKSDNTAMYSAGAYPLILVTYDFGTPCMCIEIGDGVATAQQVMDAAEDALLTVDGMRWQNEYGSLVRLDDLPGVGKILFLGSDIRIKRALAGDVNATVSSYIISSDGIVVDGVNGGVAYVGGLNAAAIAESVRIEIDANSTVLAAILADTDDLQTNQGNWLTATGFATPTNVTDAQAALIAEHDSTQNQIGLLNDLSAAEVTAAVPTVGAIQSGLATSANLLAVKAKTDNLPASPAAIGSPMSLAAGSIAAATFVAGAINATVAPNLNATVSSRATATNMTAVKAKTDLLTFTGTDLRATLDGEQVVTDSASREASKADVSGVAAAVRSELTLELALIDVATSTRLASASYTTPDNAAAQAAQTAAEAAQTAAEAVDARLPTNPATEETAQDAADLSA